ncbi:MAG: hypothetical protein ABIE07_09265 [Candidatus Zixiibacteriota bacterium]
MKNIKYSIADKDVEYSIKGVDMGKFVQPYKIIIVALMLLSTITFRVSLGWNCRYSNIQDRDKAIASCSEKGHNFIIHKAFEYIEKNKNKLGISKIDIDELYVHYGAHYADYPWNGPPWNTKYHFPSDLEDQVLRKTIDDDKISSTLIGMTTVGALTGVTVPYGKDIAWVEVKYKNLHGEKMKTSICILNAGIA